MSSNLSEDQALILISMLIEGKGSDEEATDWIEQLENSGLTEISDLIFQDRRRLTPKQILEEAKKKSQPILL